MSTGRPFPDLLDWSLLIRDQRATSSPSSDRDVIRRAVTHPLRLLRRELDRHGPLTAGSDDLADEYGHPVSVGHHLVIRRLRLAHREHHRRALAVADDQSSSPA